MSSFRTVYVSRGATVEQVQSAVEVCLPAVGRGLVAHVEFGDEYPGYVTAIDMYGLSDAETNAAATALAAALAPLLPGCAIATDLELGERAAGSTECPPL